MNESTRRRFLATAALGSSAFVAACVSPGSMNQPALQGKSTMKKVSFKRAGLTLAGNLYTPAGFDEKAPLKAVVVAGSFSSVKEQMSGTYVQKLADKGFLALAIDYAYYGESEGLPRQYENPAEKLSDLQAAVTYLSALPYVKSVGMVGICASAGNGATLAAADPRVKAFATVAGFLPDPQLYRMMMGDEELANHRKAAVAAKLKFQQTGEQVMVPTYSTTDKAAASYNAEPIFDYYFSPARGGIPQWKNATAVVSFGSMFDFDPIASAPAIKIPTLVVHSDESAFPDQAKKFHAQLGGVKELAWGDGNHYDYYDSHAQIDFAVKNVTAFFNRHLA